MRPRSRTPWKAPPPRRPRRGRGVALQCGHGVELRGKFGTAFASASKPSLQCGHGGELRGRTVVFCCASRCKSWELQCGHGGELRGRQITPLRFPQGSQASMRPRRGTPWKGSRRPGDDTAGLTGRASMRPRRGTPWKVTSRRATTLTARNSGASMRPRRGTPWKVYTNVDWVIVYRVLQCGHGGELRGKSR